MHFIIIQQKAEMRLTPYGIITTATTTATTASRPVGRCMP